VTSAENIDFGVFKPDSVLQPGQQVIDFPAPFANVIFG
jgi:hypothetical protein